MASEIRAAEDEFERLVRAKSASGLAKQVYAEDAILVVPDQPTLTGRAEIAEYWHGMFRVGLTDITLTIARVEASGDLAVEKGRFSCAIRFERAEQIQEIGCYLAIHRRHADGPWRVIAHVVGQDDLQG